MKWTKFTLKTTTEAVDLISSMLDEIGIEGIEIEDNVPLSDADTKGMFIDILPELPPDDGTAKVSFYVDDLSNLENIIHQVNAGLDEIAEFVNVGERSLSVSETEDKDWINNWKQYFKPFTVDDILIKPTWETIPEEHKDKLLIQIDPGTAFGTGMHETTQLCIRQLRKYVNADSEIIDVGTRSGILGIAALRLWARTWNPTTFRQTVSMWFRATSSMIRLFRTRLVTSVMTLRQPTFWLRSSLCCREKSANTSSTAACSSPLASSTPRSRMSRMP